MATHRLQHTIVSKLINSIKNEQLRQHVTALAKDDSRITENSIEEKVRMSTECLLHVLKARELEEEKAVAIIDFLLSCGAELNQHRW